MKGLCTPLRTTSSMASSRVNVLGGGAGGSGVGIAARGPRASGGGASVTCGTCGPGGPAGGTGPDERARSAAPTAIAAAAQMPSPLAGVVNTRTWPSTAPARGGSGDLVPRGVGIASSRRVDAAAAARPNGPVSIDTEPRDRRRYARAMSARVQLAGLEEACRTEEGRRAARVLLAGIALDHGSPLAPALVAPLAAIARGEPAPPDRAELEHGFEATFAAYEDNDWYDGSLGEFHASLGRVIEALLSDDPAILAARCQRSAEEHARSLASRRMAQLAHELGYCYEPSLPDVVAAEEARRVEARWAAARS